MVLFLFGCALQESQEPTSYDISRATRVFSAGYQDVTDIYIEDLKMGTLAVAGLDGLSNIDPDISTAYHDDIVMVSLDEQEIGHFKVPSQGDLESWGNLTAAAIAAARLDSVSLGGAEPEALYEAVFSGMIEELDDFSRYSGRDQARENRASRDGFGGIGVRIRVVDEGVKILSVMDDTPAMAAGLEDRDLITHIDGETAAGLSQRDIVRRLRGPLRTTVAVTVQREEEPEPLSIDITRAHIVPQTVKYRAEGDIGYLRVSGFNQSTSQTLRLKILQAEREMGKNLKGFVLDLRGNPGGLLDQAVSVSDLFMRRGRIVSTHGRHPDSHQFFNAEEGDMARDRPIVVLINGNSASASEIVAAALQDSGRGVVVGSNSFGKGTVQTVLRLPNEGELTLTWARFYAPSGYTLQKRGVLPDICTSGTAIDATELLQNVRSGTALTDRAYRTRVIDAADTKELAAFRAHCPLSETEEDIDLKLALALLNDQGLYAQVLRQASAETAERATN